MAKSEKMLEKSNAVSIRNIQRQLQCLKCDNKIRTITLHGRVKQKITFPPSNCDDIYRKCVSICCHADIDLELHNREIIRTMIRLISHIF